MCATVMQGLWRSEKGRAFRLFSALGEIGERGVGGLEEEVVGRLRKVFGRGCSKAGHQAFRGIGFGDDGMAAVVGLV